MTSSQSNENYPHGEIERERERELEIARLEFRIKELTAELSGITDLQDSEDYAQMIFMAKDQLDKLKSGENTRSIAQKVLGMLHLSAS